MNHARFSLRSLLVLSLFLVMTLVIAMLSQELIPLRAEVQRLRDEAGYLTIGDPTKVHAIQVETNSPLMWKWKVYVPADADAIGVDAKVGEIPTEGVEPTIGRMWIDNVEPIEVIITARIHKDLQDKWMLTTEFVHGTGSSSSSEELTHAQVARLNASALSSLKGVGRKTESFEFGTIALYRRLLLPPNTWDSVDLSGSGPGVLIWIGVYDSE